MPLRPFSAGLSAASGTTVRSRQRMIDRASSVDCLAHSILEFIRRKVAGHPIQLKFLGLVQDGANTEHDLAGFGLSEPPEAHSIQGPAPSVVPLFFLPWSVPWSSPAEPTPIQTSSLSSLWPSGPATPLGPLVVGRWILADHQCVSRNRPASVRFHGVLPYHLYPQQNPTHPNSAELTAHSLAARPCRRSRGRQARAATTKPRTR